MVKNNDTPDPDRGDNETLENEESPPQIFINGDSEEEDQDVGEHGYQMLQQNENVEDDEDDDHNDPDVSREEEIAALVRAAQADPENLSDATRELIEQSNERQKAEERAESLSVWAQADNCRDNSIKLSDEKIETIKSLMSGVVLGNVPSWAKDLDTSADGAWRQKMRDQGSSKSTGGNT